MTAVPPQSCTLPATLAGALAAPAEAPWPVVAVRRETWERWFAGAPEVLEVIRMLPDRVRYDDVAGLVPGLADRGHNVPGAFAAVLLWAYGSNGRGAYKTAQMLTGRVKPRGTALEPSVARRLVSAASTARAEGASAGFEYLAGPGAIWKLGPAFSTKWLHFAAGDSNGGRPPMLDSVVTAWLAEQDPALHLNYAGARDYARYLDMLAAWGDALGVAPVDVGNRVYCLSRGFRARRTGR